MLINTKYKFLFVHIQKTAGTSITEQLIKLPETKRISNAHSLINQINIKDYDEYFKFCFVRNPFDRLYSWWNMMKNKGIHNDFSRYLLKSKSFSDFLEYTDIIEEKNPEEIISEGYIKSISFNQLDYIIDNSGNIAVDFIGRFENINNDFKFISDKIGLNLTLSHSNKFEHDNYRSYYSEEDIKKVYTVYKRDIDFFNYQF